jgi:hypothetical protein
VQVKEGFNNVVVLDFCLWVVLRSFVGETLAASEQEVAQSDLVVASFGVNALTVVKNVHPEVFWRHSLDTRELLASLEKLDVHGGASRVTWADDYLLTEDDTVLGGHIGVGVLNRLALHNFLESKRLSV